MQRLAAAGALVLVTGFMGQLLSGVSIDPEQVNPQLLSDSALVGVTAYIIWGIISAAQEEPENWADSAVDLLEALGVSHPSVVVCMSICRLILVLWTAAMSGTQCYSSIGHAMAMPSS